MTIVETPTRGVFGGYLVLADNGRPLEFHCTVPIKLSRAQEILYGPTLKPCLFAECIGPALLEKSQRKTGLILVDTPTLLALPKSTRTPTAYVLPGSETISDESRVLDSKSAIHIADPLSKPYDGDSDGPVSIEKTPCSILRAGHHRLAFPMSPDRDPKPIVDQLTQLSGQLDLSEPFSRIRQAILEAQKLTGQSPENPSAQAA